MRCLAEDCRYWTGDGCACAFLDIEPEWADVGPTDLGTNMRAES